MATKQKILIVDDDNNIAELVALYLTKECFETKIVNDGEEALKQFHIFHPDLILLDNEMPIINGRQVFEMIRSEKDFETIPIMFLTSCNDKNVVMDIARLKPEGYLLKTMKPERIITEVDAFFAEKRGKQL